MENRPIDSYILKTESSDINVEVFHTVTSTNDICRLKAEENFSGEYAAIAMNQTRGRGRMGRSFFSPDNTGLYMSLLLRPHDLHGSQAVRLTTIAAVAAAEAIEEISGRRADIKWVNDILINDRKVCGILTEGSFSPADGGLEYSVAGIGVNLFTPCGGFPEDIRDIAGSVFPDAHESSADAAGYSDHRSRGATIKLAELILCRFMHYYADFLSAVRNGNPAEYVDEYRRRSLVTGREINVIRSGRETVPAYAIGIDDECGLMVRYADGTEETLRSGEITIRMI